MGEKHEIQYNPKQEFALGNVYNKLTRGIEYVAAEDAVDGLLSGADILRRSMGQLLHMFYQDAEQRQGKVMSEKAVDLEKLSTAALEAAKSGDVNQYDALLQQVVTASVKCKESSAKMKYIKGRGIEGYDPDKAVRECIEELETTVNGKQRYQALPSNGNGSRLEQKVGAQ